MQLAASMQASSSQTAVSIQQEDTIKALHKRLTAATEELQQVNDLNAGHKCVSTVSRACSPVSAGEFPTARDDPVTIVSMADGAPFCGLDARSTLEHLYAQLNAARLENKSIRRCKYGTSSASVVYLLLGVDSLDSADAGMTHGHVWCIWRVTTRR